MKQYVKNGDLKECDVQIIMEYQKLLPVLQQEDGSLINARTLHKELGVKKKFADWIKMRIEKYEFVNGEDYKLDFPKKGNQNSHGGDRKSKTYSLTLDMAKELSMLENNDFADNDLG